MSEFEDKNKEEAVDESNEPTPSMDTTGEQPVVEAEQQTDNGGFTVGGAGESGDDSGLSDIPKPSGPTAGNTDTDPVLDSEADFSQPTVEYVEDTNEIKSRREEEDEQHARREAGDAKIEALVEKSGRTPF